MDTEESDMQRTVYTTQAVLGPLSCRLRVSTQEALGMAIAKAGLGWAIKSH
jgi:hypothetical protein